jgi:hypothetical protein
VRLPVAGSSRVAFRIRIMAAVGYSSCKAERPIPAPIGEEGR